MLSLFKRPLQARVVGLFIGREFHSAQLGSEMEENLGECSSNGALLHSKLWRIKLLLLLEHCSYYNESYAISLLRGLWPLLAHISHDTRSDYAIYNTRNVLVCKTFGEIKGNASWGTHPDFEQDIKPSQLYTPRIHTYEDDWIEKW